MDVASERYLPDNLNNSYRLSINVRIQLSSNILLMPKQHPVGFGWQPKAATKLTDSIPRTLELTLTKTFNGTMDEAVHEIEDDVEWFKALNNGIQPPEYIPAKTKVDGWSTELIWKELYKHGH